MWKWAFRHPLVALKDSSDGPFIFSLSVSRGLHDCIILVMSNDLCLLDNFLLLLQLQAKNSSLTLQALFNILELELNEIIAMTLAKGY